MSNKKAMKEKMEHKGKTVEEMKEIAQTLQTQLQNHQKEANHHNTMAMKAQGALEVMLQMIPKEEVKNIEDTVNNNGEESRE
tara:strand:- start:397 stop:642 length:246 start_codon:yes stop_codon:yes gene_type:complete